MNRHRYHTAFRAALMIAFNATMLAPAAIAQSHESFEAVDLPTDARVLQLQCSHIPLPPPPRTPVLHAGIEHNVSLPPVDNALRTGTTPDMRKLRALTPDNQWSRLPNWAAGTWRDC